MPTDYRGKSPSERLLIISGEIKAGLPQLYGWWENETDFTEVRVKARDDGSMLAIAKGFDSDGSPVVAFGVGYGVVASLMALNATITGGHWKVDKYA